MTYNLRTKFSTITPRFLSINRATKTIEIDSPVLGASPAEVGTFLMLLVIRDIYGDELSFDFTVIVEQ